MRRGNQRVGRNIVVRVAQIVWRKEHEGREEDQEDANAECILGGVIRMEWQGVFLGLRLNAERVVGPGNMQGCDMQDHNADNDEWQQVMQGKEAVKGRVIDRETTPEPGDDIVTDQRYRREQVGNNRGTPEAHLAPWQDIAHERGGHHQQQDHNTKHPEQLARCLV